MIGLPRNPHHIHDFLIRLRTQAVATRLTYVTTLRSFFRWAAMTGLLPRDLSAAVPSPRQFKQRGLRDALTECEVTRLLHGVDRSSTIGRRDYAVLLLAARYGLRPCDLRQLRLEAVDWRERVLSITQAKTGRVLTLPLLPDVADALIAYLRNGRPATPSRYVQRLADATLVVGRTVGIDATTLEANAAMRSIVRRDTGESYDAFLTRLAEASGLTTPTRAELARFDRTRKKKGSNADWTHPHDPDAKIAKMKDGRTHLAHTAEHAVDLETGAIVGVTVQDASAGDTTTLVDTLVTAAEQVEAVGAPGIVEVVADKGYHSNETMVGFAAIGVRSYVSEPDRGRRHWKGQAAARDAVYANRRRIRGARGKRLLRQRGELLERPNAHLYETGRMRRVHLRGHPNILKRLLVQVCGVNLGLLMRHLTGVGTPRSLQGRASALLEALIGLLSECWGRVRRFWAPERHDRPDSSGDGPATRQYGHAILD